MSFPYTPRLDRRVCVTGTYDAGTGKTTWTLPFTDDTIDAIVLGSDFTVLNGRVLTPDSNVSGTVQIDGDYSAGQVVIGRLYTKSVELSRPYVRDRNGVADPDARVTMRHIVTQHQNTGEYSIRAVKPTTTTRERTFNNGGIDTLEETGSLKAFLQGDTDATIWFLRNASAKPSAISNLEFIVDYAPKDG